MWHRAMAVFVDLAFPSDGAGRNFSKGKGHLRWGGCWEGIKYSQLEFVHLKVCDIIDGSEIRRAPPGMVLKPYK